MSSDVNLQDYSNHSLTREIVVDTETKNGRHSFADGHAPSIMTMSRALAE
jgi:hypothetical protein